MHKDDQKRGAWLVIGSSFMFASMGVCVKMVSPNLPTEVVVFFRNFFAFLTLLPLLVHTGTAVLKTDNVRFHFVRAAAGLAAMYCLFYAIAHLHLAEAMLLNYTTPLFAPLLALIWLREPVSSVLRWALLVGFFGITLILNPSAELLRPAALVGLISGVLAAVALVTVRRMSETEPAIRIVFYFSGFGVLVTAVPLLWAWQTPSVAQFGWLAAGGAFALFGQLLITAGYSCAPVAKVGPFTYSAVVFAAMYGWLLWGEFPVWTSVLGIALVVGAGVLALKVRPPAPVRAEK